MWSKDDGRSMDELQELADGSFEETSVPLLSEEEKQHWQEIFGFNLFNKIAEEQKGFNDLSHNDVRGWLKAMDTYNYKTNKCLQQPGIIFATKKKRDEWQNKNDEFYEDTKTLAAKFEFQYKQHMLKSDMLLEKWNNADYQYYQDEIISPLSAVNDRKRAGTNAIEKNCGLYTNMISDWERHEKELERLIRNLWTYPVLEMQPKIIELRNTIRDFCDQHDQYE